MALWEDIHAQPEVAERLLVDERRSIAAIATSVYGEFDHVAVVARGSSDHVAVFAQYLFGVAHGFPVALAAPSILTMYGQTPRFRRTLVVGISQSGASPDVVGYVAAAREQGAPTIAVTNTASSPLARVAEHVILLNAGPEAVAATKTYTASLLAVAMLSAAWGGSPGLAALARVPALMTTALLCAAEAEAAARRFASIDRCVVVGRGFGYPTAREWALKLQELAHVVAVPFSSADFRHGPIALIESGFPVLATASEGAAGEDVAALLEEVRTRHAAVVLAVSDRPDVVASGGALPFPRSVPDALAPLVSIIPIQLFVGALARAKGLDPDAPRYLHKVTETN